MIALHSLKTTKKREGAPGEDTEHVLSLCRVRGMSFRMYLFDLKRVRNARQAMINCFDFDQSRAETLSFLGLPSKWSYPRKQTNITHVICVDSALWSKFCNVTCLLNVGCATLTIICISFASLCKRSKVSSLLERFNILILPCKERAGAHSWDMHSIL